MRKLNAYFNLMRGNMALLTLSVPVMGLLLLEVPYYWYQLICLCLLGLSAHAFGFGLNDIVDYPIDKTVPYRQKSPLVSGVIGRVEAWVFVLLQIPLSFALYIWALGGSGAGIIALSGSIAGSIIYNLWSKRGFLFRFVAELSLAASLALLLLAAVFVFVPQMPLYAVFFALALLFILLQLNSVPSGLKDIKTDSRFGAQSFVLSAGAKMLDEDKYQLSTFIYVYSFAIQVFIAFCLSLVAWLKLTPWYYCLPMALLWAYASVHLHQLLKINSCAQLLNFSPLLGGYFNYFSLTLLITSQMPFIWWLPLAYFLVYPLRESILLPKKKVVW